MRALALVTGLMALALTIAPVDAAMMGKDRFMLTSPDIKPGGKIPDQFIFNGFGCAGRNISPALAWSGAPAGTKSFVLTIYDPDAPTGSGFWHLVMFDIPASVTSLPEGAGAPGKGPSGSVLGGNDFGTPGYGGPCPPAGARPHRYIFTLYAVNTDKLQVPPNPTDAVIGFVTHFATIGKASFTALYGR